MQKILSAPFMSGIKKCTSFVVLLFFTSYIFFAGPFLSRAVAFWDFTVTDEKELGRKFNVMIRSSMPIVMDPEVVDYINKMVERLSEKLPPQPFPFQASIIRHNAINAFATPGGYVFVYTGLILAMDSEAELAGVLGHEMAHVTQRHVASRIEKSQKVAILSLLGILAGAFMGGEAGGAAAMGSAALGQSALLSYSRADEYDADQIGMGYLIGAGYAPQGMVEAFKILRQKQWISGGRNIPSYLSTHPALGERVSELQGRINAMPDKIKKRSGDNTEFLRIQALVRARYADPDPAIHTFQEQLNTKNRCNALLGLGILYSRLNKIPEASSSFEQALKCSPNTELILREAGRFHYTKGDNVKAANYLQQALNLDRKDYMAQFFYARLLDDSGTHIQAQDYYRDILRHVPEDSEVHYYYAQSLGKSQQMFKANLHMAYSALYENNEKKVQKFLKEAKKFVKTIDDKAYLEKFEEEYRERKAFWR